MENVAMVFAGNTHTLVAHTHWHGSQFVIVYKMVLIQPRLKLNSKLACCRTFLLSRHVKS